MAVVVVGPGELVCSFISVLGSDLPVDKQGSSLYIPDAPGRHHVRDKGHGPHLTVELVWNVIPNFAVTFAESHVCNTKLTGSSPTLSVRVLFCKDFTYLF